MQTQLQCCCANCGHAGQLNYSEELKFGHISMPSIREYTNQTEKVKNQAGKSNENKTLK